MQSFALPYATAVQPALRDLNGARDLVAAELRTSAAAAMRAIQEQSLRQQSTAAREWEDYKTAVSAAWGLAVEGDVRLSPISGHQRLTTSAGLPPASREWTGLFAPAMMPVADSERGFLEHHSSSRKRDREEANGEGAAAEDSSDDAVGLGHHHSRAPVVSRRNTHARDGTQTPPELSALASDAVYYEALLSQSVGAKIFLGHSSAVLGEGGAFLRGLQHTQEMLFASQWQVDQLNALRYVEQQAFSHTITGLNSQINRSREKIGALERTMTASSSSGAETASRTVSLLSSLVDG